MTARLPDAGTTNTWTVVGKLVVSAIPAHPFGDGKTNPLVLITNNETRQAIVVTPHQARALCEVLPAAANYADPPEEGQ